MLLGVEVVAVVAVPEGYIALANPVRVYESAWDAVKVLAEEDHVHYMAGLIFA